MNCWAASRSHRRRARYIGRFPRPLDSMNVTAVLVIRPTRHFALTQRDRTSEQDMKATARIAAGKSDWRSSCPASQSKPPTGFRSTASAQYSVTAFAVPSQFGEDVRRRADYFETLLAILKVLAHAPKGEESDWPFWRQRADAAIAKAKAILAGACDPVIEGGAP